MGLAKDALDDDGAFGVVGTIDGQKTGRDRLDVLGRLDPEGLAQLGQKRFVLLVHATIRGPAGQA